MQLHHILQQIHPLPESSMAALVEHITELSLPKGYLLLKADKVEQQVFFIKKGMVRAYSSAGDTDDVTFWMGKEGDTVISMKSYVAGEKGYENIELLEDCELFRLQTAALQQLFTQDIHIANWGRRFAEQELVKTEERLIARLFKTATERYLELMNQTPHLLQRVPLRHIASYLGITQVSLSRIRKQASRL